MLIRICTEDCGNLPAITQIVPRYFPGFTIYQGMGMWNGQSESSLTIDIALLEGEREPEARSKSVAVAREIQRLNKQEAVLIEYIYSENIMVRAQVH